MTNTKRASQPISATPVRRRRGLSVLATVAFISVFTFGSSGVASAATRRVTLQALPSQTVRPGEVAKFPLLLKTVGPVGPLTFTVSGAPAGASTSVVNVGSNRYQLEVNVPSNATPGSSTIVVKVRSLAASKFATVYLDVQASAPATAPASTFAPTTSQPNPVGNFEFGVRADTPEVTITSKQTAVFGFTVDRSSGYLGDVAFTVSGLPNGVTSNFAPNPTRLGTVMYATASASVPQGRYTLTVRAASNAQNVKFASVLLNVRTVNDFALDVPSTANVVQGGETPVVLQFRTVGTATPTVSLGVGGLPAGVTAHFTPNPTFGNSTLIFNATATSVSGVYPLTVSGSVGNISHTYPITLVVGNTTAGGFGLSATPLFRSVSRGSSTTYSVVVTPTGGFSSPITWVVAGLPSGVAVAISAPQAPSINLGITIPSGVKAGAYLLTLTGSSGSLAASVSVTLTIT